MQGYAIRKEFEKVWKNTGLWRDSGPKLEEEPGDITG